MEKNRSHKASLIISAILIAGAAGLSAAARMVPGFAQWYSTTVYPVLQGSLGKLCGQVSFSVSEVLCAVLPAALILDIIVVIVRRRKISHPVLTLLRHILITVSILIFVYTANCGINYYRQPFADRDAFDKAAFSVDELADFCEYSVLQIQNSSGSHPDGINYASGAKLADGAVKAMEKLSDSPDISFCDLEGLRGYYPRPKQLTWLSGFFSMMGVSGIYSPFTIEANVNGMMTDLEKPFTSCHELSHLRGFMNEGEANFIGWLACIGSDDSSFRRSGWLIAWIYAGNSLYSADPDRYYSIRKKLPEDALRELEENSLFWSTHENKASEVQDRVNDAYLKSNGQDHGIQTYGQLTTLMLMWYSQKD